jgi:hypothetical protein
MAKSKTRHVVSEDRMKSLEQKVDRLVGAILGNGHEGLLIRVDRIEQKEERRGDMATRIDRLEQKAATRTKLTWTLISVGGAAVATALAALIL